VPESQNLHELSRAIGALEAGIAGLSKIVDDECHESKRHRDALRETIGSLAEAVRVLTAEVTEMKPIVADARRSADQRQGQKNLGNAIMAFWMAVSGIAVSTVTWWLSRRA
jgi:hypothetical protein